MRDADGRQRRDALVLEGDDGARRNGDVHARRQRRMRHAERRGHRQYRHDRRVGSARSRSLEQLVDGVDNGVEPAADH